MVKGKARAAGSFLGGIFNNPGIIIIGLVLGGLFLFRDKISGAFGSLGEGLGDINITLPEIKLPEITFPDFNFPDFPDFSDLFGGFQTQLDQLFKNQQSILAGQTVPGAEGQPVQIPPDTVIDPDTGIVTSSTPPTTQTTGDDLSTLFGELRPQVFDTLVNIGLSPKDAAIALRDVTTITGLNQVLQSFNVILGGGEPISQQGTAALNPLRFLDPVKSFLIDEPTQKFEGGGVSFTGGSIFETPIANLSLSQIIDKFGVTASQAANLRAIDIGFTPEEEEFLQGSGDIFGFTGFNPPAVSDFQFQGLTPQEIALRLTGGNISNF